MFPLMNLSHTEDVRGKQRIAGGLSLTVATLKYALKTKSLFQFEIIINVLVSTYCFI